MKHAICIYGYSGYTDSRHGQQGEKIDLNMCYNHIKKNILQENENVDLFIFSKEIELKDKILDIYKPKKYLFEKQSNHGFDIGEVDLKNFSTNGEYDWFQAFSQWHAIYKSLHLAVEYENENNFKYYNILLMRLDVAILKKMNLSLFDPKFLHFQPKKNNFFGPPVYAHAGLGFIITSDNLKKINYTDILNFNYKTAEDKNIFKYDTYLRDSLHNQNNTGICTQKIFWHYSCMLIFANEVKLSINHFELIRRYYYASNSARTLRENSFSDINIKRLEYYKKNYEI